MRRFVKRVNLSQNSYIERIKETYGSQFVNIFEPEESIQQDILNFLKQFPDAFVWHYIDDSVYAVLFKLEVPQREALAPALVCPQSAPQSTGLVQRVYEFLQNFIQESDVYHSISEVCSAYGKASGKSLTEQLKGKRLGAKPRQFFQNHPQYFSLRPTQDNNWEVTWISSESV